GALHSGHASLGKKCAKENDIIVVSIFVNPTQFNNPEDLDKYPRNLERDLDFLSKLSNKPLLVFAPEVEEVYSTDVESENFDFKGLELEMEGKFRPGHFDGVATIVSKLFKIVKPSNAYFGEKDYQQLLIIDKMVESLELPVKIVPCEIYREKDGLAMSSRNERLTSEQRNVASLIYKVLRTAKNGFGIDNVTLISEWVKDQFNSEPLLELEYFTMAEAATLKPVKTKEANKRYRAFIAAYAGDVRLIDNMALN
ncbi:MAG: pantoate--beta-alanine ligase, partial [Bacteroidota bacterium]